MRILITGGAGYLGSELVLKLSKDRKNKIQVVDSYLNNSIKRKANIELPIVASINNHLDVTRIMERFKPEVVIHLASFENRPETFGDFRKCAEVNYLGTANVANAILSLKFPPKKFIFSSSLAAKEPVGHFGIAKRAAEDLLKSIFVRFPELKVQLTILRFSEIFGMSSNWNSKCLIHFFIDNFLLNNNLAVYSVDKQIDCLHISDAIRAFEQVLSIEEKQGLYDIGSGQGQVIQDLINLIREKTDYIGQLRFLENSKVPIQTLIADSKAAEQDLEFKATADFNLELDRLIKKRKKVLK